MFYMEEYILVLYEYHYYSRNMALFIHRNRHLFAIQVSFLLLTDVIAKKPHQSIYSMEICVSK